MCSLPSGWCGDAGKGFRIFPLTPRQRDHRSSSNFLLSSFYFLYSEFMDQANILIIGGGVIGCAIANAVSKRWQDVFLVEKFPKLGMATSTRNSGVNHSGIYYPKDSLKARHCVEGNRLTYEFCAKHKVPFRHTGKLVVAANAHEEGELAALKQRGEDNGVEGLRILGPAEIRAREPHISGVAALDVPSAGVV